MDLNHELTHLQKMAFQGEMALTLSTAPHTAEVMYRIYLVLRETPEKFRPLLVEITRDLITFPETELDRIILEVSEGSTPTWLWIKKTIADLKESLVLNEMNMTCPIKVDKKRARQMIIESAFTRFARQALAISPSTTSTLCHEILEDRQLEFLHTTAFSLLSDCQEVAQINKEEDGVSEVLLDCIFSVKEILSSRLETEALELLNDPKKAHKHLDKMFSKLTSTEIPENAELIGSFDIPADHAISQDELSQYLSEKISELFEGVSKTTTPTKYIVRKTFKGSNASSTLKVFDTKKEAMEFISQLKKDFPELEKTCVFEILKQPIRSKKD